MAAGGGSGGSGGSTGAFKPGTGSGSTFGANHEPFGASLPVTFGTLTRPADADGVSGSDIGVVLPAPDDERSSSDEGHIGWSFSGTHHSFSPAPEGAKLTCLPADIDATAGQAVVHTRRRQDSR